MFRRIDRSPRFAQLIASISDFIARRRGLPIVVGISLVLISFVLQLFDVYVDSQLLQVCAVITLNAGIIIALIGLLLAQPLGK